MTPGVPAGFVDPPDRAEVAAVLRATLDRLGMPGLVDLLTRVPGVQVDPGQASGVIRRGRPARVVGSERVIVLGGPVVCEHVVGGIVLSRTPVRPGDLPDLLAGVVRDAVAESGDAEPASIVITSVRDALGTGD
jgi:hypothetical protein